MRNCKDELEFQAALDGFLDQKLDAQSIDFLVYFRSYYAGRAEQWAHCFWKGIPFTTNNHLEAMHRDLKSNYMHGTHNQRLDKLLMILFELTRDRLYKRLKSLIKGKTNRHAAALFQRHQEGMKIPRSDIERVQNGNGWLVKSQSEAGRSFTVEKKSDPCQGCVLRCKDCDICIDSYHCSCNDSLISASICKHIHSVAYLELHATAVEEVDTEPPASHDGMLPSTSRDAPGSALDDESHSLLNDIRHKVELSMQKSQQDSVHEVDLAMNALRETLSRKELSSSCAFVVDRLGKLREEFESLPDKSPSAKPKVIPHNKKMEKQPRYISKKKKRSLSSSTHVKPPTRLEQQCIMKDLAASQVPTQAATSTQPPVNVQTMSMAVLRDHDYYAVQ
ncbi:unnamed protein product [Ixodes hexagonus]